MSSSEGCSLVFVHLISACQQSLSLLGKLACIHLNDNNKKNNKTLYFPFSQSLKGAAQQLTELGSQNKCNFKHIYKHIKIHTNICTYTHLHIYIFIRLDTYLSMHKNSYMHT